MSPMQPSSSRGVLLIEDDDALRKILAHALRLAGFLVRTARDERTALAEFARQTPAAVVTDLVLPGGEGLRAVQTMRRARPKLPIVVMSGGGMFASDQLLCVAKGCGADAALSKPFGARELVACLSELLAPPLPELAA